MNVNRKKDDYIRSQLPTSAVTAATSGNESRANLGAYAAKVGKTRGRRRMTLLQFLHLSEDNARFFLLAIILIIYAIIGATLFMSIEADAEMARIEERLRKIQDFRIKYTNVKRADLNELLEINLFFHTDNTDTYSAWYIQTLANNASSPQISWGNDQGGMNRRAIRKRWDFIGALYFMFTLMTTTGYGMTTPKTELGRAVTVLLGYFGCTFTILFFNLFLERVITLLTFVITTLHQWAKNQRRWFFRRSSSADTTVGIAGLVAKNPAELEKMQEEAEQIATLWKPSLYAVFSAVFLMSSCAILICSLTFVLMEDTWSFLDSVYSDFVPAFGTGSSDAYSNKDSEQTWPMAYRVSIIFALGFGTCCYYSLFNVSSILVKRFLTVVISKLDIDVTSLYNKCCRRHRARYASHVAKPASDAEPGGKLNPGEHQKRQSMIAQLRAAAVDKALTRYDSRVGASSYGISSISSRDRLASTASKCDRLQSFKSECDGMSPVDSTAKKSLTSLEMAETTFSPLSTQGQATKKNEVPLRGRPKPMVMHPTVVDSDDDEYEFHGRDDSESSDNDNSGYHGKSEYAVKSEALRKVGMMKNNAIVLALMQKELHAEKMRREQTNNTDETFDGQPVGPLAIVKNMFD